MSVLTWSHSSRCRQSAPKRASRSSRGSEFPPLTCCLVAICSGIGGGASSSCASVGPNDLAPPAESDYEVKIMWLRNPVGGGLVAVREFKAKGGVREAASLAASVPKALGVSRVVPCVFSERHGVVVGDEITLTD